MKKLAITIVMALALPSVFSVNLANMTPEQARIIRKKYAETIHIHYLDQGLDIHVAVSGWNSDRITLTYSLFNDVWARRMQTGGELDELRAFDFCKLTMTDGFDYLVYWNLGECPKQSVKKTEQRGKTEQSGRPAPSESADSPFLEKDLLV